MSGVPVIQALKPCPFCGCEAEIERVGDSRKSTLYVCTSCGCSLETGEEWGHGARWNQRAGQASTDDLVEAFDGFGDAMFDLSARLLHAGFFEGDGNHDAYETVVTHFQRVGAALTKAGAL